MHALPKLHTLLFEPEIDVVFAHQCRYTIYPKGSSHCHVTKIEGAVTALNWVDASSGRNQ